MWCCLLRSNHRSIWSDTAVRMGKHKTQMERSKTASQRADRQVGIVDAVCSIERAMVLLHTGCVNR